MRIITREQIKSAVQKALDEDRLQPPGGCTYQDCHFRPCAIGACLTEEERAWIRRRCMNEPKDQHLALALHGCPFGFEDLEFAVRVQSAFDMVDMPSLRRLIAE
jgi:hypothetical protein